MATNLQGGAGIPLGLRPLAGLNNTIELAAGQFQIVPAGQYLAIPGPYSWVQVKDPINGRWMTPQQTPNGAQYVTSDGGNVRLANLTGCALGAYVTNVGSAYTSAPTIAASSGGSTWTAIVGGAINATVTITTAGAGYNYPPQLVVSAPPPGGVPCTMTCTLSSGAINAVTVVDQGAGYLIAPTITVVPDPREPVATTPGPTTTGVLTAALTGSGTITAVICTNHGTALTAVPTLTFTGGGGASAAATVVMCFTATGATVVAAGVAYGTSLTTNLLTTGGQVTGAAGATVNPAISTGLLTPRQALATFTSTAGGAITGLPSLAFTDTGLFAAVPNGVVFSGTAIPTTIGTVTMTVGGASDRSLLQPLG